MTTSGRARALRTEDPRRTAETHLVWASQPSPVYASVTPIAGASWGARFRWPTNPACTTTTTAPLPDNLHGAGLPLVSDRVRAWLVGLGSFFELSFVGRAVSSGALSVHLEPMRKHGMVYFAIVGGAAALETTQIEEIEEVAWEDLMPECLWKFRVKDFGPLTVGIDAHGGSLYHDVQARAHDKLKELYARL
jgi:hypothetical protein